MFNFIKRNIIYGVLNTTFLAMNRSSIGNLQYFFGKDTTNSNSKSQFNMQDLHKFITQVICMLNLYYVQPTASLRLRGVGGSG